MDAGLGLLIAGIVSIGAGLIILFILNYISDYGEWGFKMGIIISAVGLSILFASLFKFNASVCGF